MLAGGGCRDAPPAADMVDTIEGHHRVQMERFEKVRERVPKLQQQLAEAVDPQQVKQLTMDIAQAREAEVQYLLTVGPLLANYDPKNQAIKGQQFRDYIELTCDEGAKKRLRAREIQAACISRKHKKIRGRRNVNPDIADSVCECGGRKVTVHSEATLCVHCLRPVLHLPG